MALAATGHLDVVAAALSTAFYNAVSRTLPVKFVASTAYQPKVGHPSALLIREDLYEAGARTPAALRGKKIGWLGGSGAIAAYYVARILRPYGLSVKDVEPVNLSNPDQGVALERKAVDAVFSNSPFTEAFQQRKLARIIGFPPAGISGSGVFFGPSLLDHIDAARDVMNALRQSGARSARLGLFRARHPAGARHLHAPAGRLDSQLAPVRRVSRSPGRRSDRRRRATRIHRRRRAAVQVTDQRSPAHRAFLSNEMLGEPSGNEEGAPS